jgi:hypothetical protein
VQPYCSISHRVGVENGRHSEGEIDSTAHEQLVQENELMNDDDIIWVESVSDVVCDGTTNWLIRQLMVKLKIFEITNS